MTKSEYFQMKYIITTIVLLVNLVFLAQGTEAGVQGSKHDMYFMGKGTDPNMCSYCHIPHNAAGDKIWSDWGNEARLTSGSSTAMGNMCYTCHDGTATQVGKTTIFNFSLQQHKITDGKDCDMCHTVHDNTNGKFSIVPKTSGENTYYETYCETCHDATMFPGAEHLGDHTAGSQHPRAMRCTGCHLVHGAYNYSTEELTNPILGYENTDSAMCRLCHDEYVQATPGGNKHPANTLDGGAWPKLTCQTCHDVHQGTVPSSRVAILREDNTNSAYCTSCHTSAGAPGIGEHTHPVLVEPTLPITDSDRWTGTPLGNMISDGVSPWMGGPDYPSNDPVVVCETCHSPHLYGKAPPLLRMTTTDSALCINCHGDK